jgi:hypothetical protein
MKHNLSQTSGASGIQLTLILILLSVPLAGCADKVTLANTSASEKGIMVDGQSSGGQVNDQSQTLAANGPFGVGQLTASPSSNEVVAFNSLHPVALQTVAWTSSDDSITVTLPNLIQIPVRVWIVQGPFAAQRTRAINACITTSSIWTNDRMGVDFNPFEVVDATADPQAANYVTFDCSKRAGIEADIGKTAGRINIYWVNTVDGGTGRGQACQIGSDFVAMGSATGDELLSHELGHDFGLQHVDGQATFDMTNIMHSASNTRQFITEGQLFRAHLRPASALNAIYAARPGLPTRNCLHGDDTDQCPRLNKRIWADGTFPAN